MDFTPALEAAALRPLNSAVRRHMNVYAKFATLLMCVLATTEAAEQRHTKQKILAVYFPTASVTHGKLFSSVRIVLTCARFSAVTYIPNDWYVETLRPPLERDPIWKEFEFTEQALVFGAGHGASRELDLKKFDGSAHVLVEDEKCFDITAVVEDDTGSDGLQKTVLKRKDLVLR